MSRINDVLTTSSSPKQRRLRIRGLKERNTFARIYRGLVDVRLTISTNAELTLKLISKLSEAAAK